MTFDYSEAFRGSIGLPNTNNVSGSEMRYRDAFNQTLRNELSRDPSVFIMGEDIRLSVYGTTANLFKEFGEDRVLDTPLSENGFFGAAIGASLVGMRPIVETVTSFMWVAMTDGNANADWIDLAISSWVASPKVKVS